MFPSSSTFSPSGISGLGNDGSGSGGITGANSSLNGLLIMIKCVQFITLTLVKTELISTLNSTISVAVKNS